MSQRIGLLDFLRGFSMATIVVFHYLQQLALPAGLKPLIFFGGTGVHLFFVLSGYTLYRSFSAKPLGYFTFLRRRFSKIYIPYIAVVTISALVSVIVPLYKEGSWYAWLGHVFLYKFADKTIIGSYGYQFWFVSTLFQLYLLFVPLYWLMKKSKPATLTLLLFVVSMAWNAMIIALGVDYNRSWNSFFPVFLWEMALGMTLAYRFTDATIEKPLPVVKLLLIGGIALVSYAFMALKGGQAGRVTNDIFALTGYTAVALLSYQWSGKALRNGVSWLGGISYSWFLWHMFFIELARVFVPQPYTTGALAISFFVGLAVAYGWDKLVAAFFQRYKI
jgi:peptidoglycan/LPS O-acetylase OafA/YrhL